jgi:EAL and modified HD-GYP domain-containing signal transduction protein
MRGATERAVLCEQLARLIPDADVSGSFTAGLISSLDAAFDLPMADVLEALPLSGELKAAVLHHHGSVGEILGCAMAVGRADWSRMRCANLTPDQIRQAYLTTLAEVDVLWSSFKS